MKPSDISIEDLKQRSLALHEPRWLRLQREQAWSSWLQTPDPNWTKSKTPELNWDQLCSLQLNLPAPAPLKIEKKPPQHSAGKITIKDGKVWRISLLPELAYQGVIFCDMQTAVLERADLIESSLKKSQLPEDKFQLFQEALWENGCFLYVPKGLKIEQPFQIQLIDSGSSSTICYRSLIFLEEGASASLEEAQGSESSDGPENLISSTLEIFLEDLAELQYLAHQNWRNDIYDLSSRSYTLKKNARLQTLLALNGASKGRTMIRGVANQPGASLEHNGIFILGNQDRFKIIAELDQEAEHTEGMMRYKGILTEQAYSDFDGLIRVGAGASKSQSRLEEHNLIMGEKARCDALPALDIQTDDVQVSHSAAISQADPEKIFYLMSRGLSEDQAKALIMEGFFEDIFGFMKNQALVAALKTSFKLPLISHA